MRCFLEANTTQIVDMPRAMRCTCAGNDNNNNETTFSSEEMVTATVSTDDILGKFRRELLAEVETISISDCDALNLRWATLNELSQSLTHKNSSRTYLKLCVNFHDSNQ